MDKFMPSRDMTKYSMAHPIRRCVLFLVLAALIGCADRGNTVPEVADQTLQTPGGPQGAPASPVPSSPGQAVSNRLRGNTPAGTADTADKKAPSAQIFKGSGVLL